MDKFDAFSMAFHTSNNLGFNHAQRIGNQIAASSLVEEPDDKIVQEPIQMNDDLRAKFQDLDDAIRSLLSIGNTGSSENEE